MIRCVSWVAILLSFAPAAVADQPGVDFVQEVLPILQNRCFRCHDARKKTASYRLDVRSAAFRGGESGKPAIVPGSSGRSELIRRVTTTDDSDSMPPGKQKLAPGQIKLLTAWIDAGARWPDALANEPRNGHWAFQPPHRPDLPQVGSPEWLRSPVDRFVLDRLEREGLRPSPEADRITLLRRLSLDVVGLPPAPQDIDTVLADKQEGAFERALERLLASPHYGERWGRLWLDAARYADSDGFEKDKPRFVWAYRDWVVQALNRDLPYDQFVIEQIAGDLLPGATQDQNVATGYLRNSMINEEGGVDPEQFRMEAMFDRMDAIGKGILGLTIQCAQCHSHKFDPLTQAEYYRMFAFLNNCHEANIVVYTPGELMARADILRKIHEIEADLKHHTPGWEAKLAAWEATTRPSQAKWTVFRPELDQSGGEKHYLLEDGSILAQGYAPTKSTLDFHGKTDLKTVSGVRLEVLNDANLPLGGPGRSTKGLFALTEFRVTITPPGGKQPHDVKIARASADVNPPVHDLDAMFADRTKRHRLTGPIAFAIDGKDETAWTTDIGPGRSNVPRQAVFVFDKPITVAPGSVVHVLLAQKHGGWNSDDNQSNNLGRFRLSLTDGSNPEADPVPSSVRAILQVPKDQRTSAQRDALFSLWRTTVPEWHDANDRIESLWGQHPQGTSQLVLETRGKRRETHMLKRGDFLKPGGLVTPAVPAFLHSLSADAPATRLSLARWLADPRSPTTARVIVNRVWQAYFGVGLVETPEDFGTQGEKPSHPELLDWLAVEFMERGWSLKALQRLIAGSATYRQAARVTPELLARDPYNRLLARGPRFRTDAEVVRDIALAASGLLNERLGGPSVCPPLPGFMLLPPVSYGPKPWPEAIGTDRYRRALYTFRFRSLPYPALQAFDAPNGDFACVRRSRSNTPLQALTALNEPIFMECAQALGLKTLSQGGATDGQRLSYAFRRCVARPPSPLESRELLALLAREKARFSRPDSRPWELAAADAKNPPRLPAGASPGDLAAWTVVSRVLLNLDETVTKE